MTHEQVIRMQVEIMNGRTWETRTDAVPDEAHEIWGQIAAELAQGEANGWLAEIPNE